MADMIVSGAGSTALNGTYVEDGTANGKPRYVYGSNSIVWNTSNQWVINSPLFYYSTDDVATPDLVTTWTKGYMAKHPVPTVTAAGGSAQNLTLSCAAGSYSLTGTAATLTYTPAAQNLTLSCGAGSYAVTGTSASLTKSLVLACESGGAYPSIVVSGAGTSEANGTYTYAGENDGKPYYMFGENLLYWFAYSYQMWVIGTNAGGVYYSYDDVATPDLCTTWTVSAGSLPVPTVMSSPATSYALTGSPVTFTVQRNYTLACAAGSYAVTGSAVTLEFKGNYVLACASGSYALTGTNADMLAQYHYTLTCSAGSYALTGTDISFGNTRAYELVCGAGSYALTGSDVSFVIARSYSLSMGAGSYSLTGTDCTLSVIHTYSLSCNSGSYLLTGKPASITSARTLGCVPGSYTLTGLEADLFKALVMPCGNGSYILTGSPATINSARTFALGMGSYVLVGTNAGLYILSPTPACRTYTIDAEGRLYTIAGDNRTYAVLQCTDDE